MSAEPTLALVLISSPRFDFVLNSFKLVEFLMEAGIVRHNCGAIYRTVSEPYITGLTLGRLKSQ